MKSSKKYLVSTACALLLPLIFTFANHDAPATQIHGIAVANMDRTIMPGNDFFTYANGAWLNRTEIPPDRASIGVFSAFVGITAQRIADLIQEAVKSKAPAGSSSRQIADLYSSFVNEAAIESRGLAPLRLHLDAIAAIKDKRDLARALGETLRADVDPLNNTNFHTPHLFGLWTAPGFSDSDRYVAYLLQGGLELPDREYYLSDSAAMKEVRTQYQRHISAMLRLARFINTDARAERILGLERSIAEKHRTLADNNDVHKANNSWNQSDFPVKAPGLDWAEYFRAAGLDKQAQFTVWQPEAFTAESALVASVSLDTWKDWLTYHLIEDHASYLPKALAEEHFNFFGKILFGTPQQLPRWRRGVFLVDERLGDAVGRIYATRYFSPQAKAEVQQMVKNLIAAFSKRIDALSWMAPSTKAQAQAKLNALYVGVGYPEIWHDYSGYEVKADDLFGNIWRGDLFEYHRQLKRLGSTVDRHEWSMSPQTVNAVNLPLQNALNFPAAILQPPFFDPQAPAAVNYGAIGAVIGHEISHTFDSEGAAFDDKGRLRNWWTSADLEHFNVSTAQLAAQYDTYKPFPDLSVNGKQCLPEDIADLAGISAAYDGYRASLGDKPAPVQQSFTGDQQFFIAFAQDWGSKTREAALRWQIVTDSHAPAMYRADTVRNLDAWYPAFNVKQDQKLYLAPSDRVRIW